MLMPRIPYHLTNGYNPEMSISLNMQHQQQHISQLLNTAATGTGIVGDVDALLTPIQNNNNNNITPVRMETGRERNLWRTNEIMEVLNIMQEINAIEMLNVKTVKSELIFRKIERIMYSRGFRKKTHVQIWTKWKFLKSTYSTSRRNGIIPKMIPQLIYDELHKMLQNANNSCSARSTSDCGNSVTSLDGDNSNGGIANSSGGSLNDSHQLIISGVEGGYEVSKNAMDANAVGGESDEENGLAHPIFGFRLGLVKQEPTDTDYETPSKIKEKDTTANIQFQTEIKQEVSEEPDSPPASDSVEESNQHNKRQSAPEIMILSRRVARPSPTETNTTTNNTTTTATTTNATSTPNNVTTSPQSRTSSTNKTVPSQLPPLRIAPFAKVPPNEVTTPISTANLPPPPPLAMNPTSRALRLNSAYSSNAYAMATRNSAAINTNSNLPNGALAYQRKLIANHHKPQAAPQPVTVSARLPVLEPTYMRRQEVVVPDLDITTAPHEYRSSQPFYGFPDGPSTSQQAQQQQIMDARKRRLRPSLVTNTIPAKRMARQNESMNSKLTARQAALEFGGEEFADDNSQNGYSEEENIATTTTYKSAAASQRTASSEPTTTTTTTNNNTDHERDQNYTKVLQDIGLSLRQMQREVINEFFKRQMRLAREEHEFQMQQDELMMQAFKEQAMQFQQMGKQLLGSAVKIEKRKKRLEKQARKQMLNNEMKQVRQMQTRLGEKKVCANMKKVLHNGIGGKAPKVEQKKEMDETEIDGGVQLLMRNVHAQLDLSDDDEDASNDANQYEYDVCEYAPPQDNSIDIEQESMETMDTQEERTHNDGTEESDEGADYESEPMQIIGH